MAEKEKIIYEIEIEADGATKGLNEIDKASTSAKESLDKTQSSFKQFGDSVKNLDFKGAIAGLGGMTKAALAFIATPLGAAIAAISAAILALTSYFKGTEEGQNRLNRIMTIGAAVMGKFSDAVIAVGKFLVDGLIKGLQGVSGFLSKVIPGFDNLTKSVEKFLNLDTATNISNIEEQIILLNRQLIVQRDVLKSEIEAAKLRAETTKDLKVRSVALAEAEQKVRKLFEMERQLAQMELEAAEQRDALSENTIEDNNKTAEAKARLFALDKERDAQLKELGTKQLAINEQLQAEIELQERLIDIKAQTIEQDNNISEVRQVNIDSLAKLGKMQFDSSKMLIANKKKEDEANRNSAELHKQLEAQKLAATSDTLGQSLGLFKQNTGAYKTIATGKAIIDTYQAANLALSTYPPPFGAIMAAISVALGLLNVAKITGVAAAGGADFVTKGPTMLIVGDNPGGREHVKVTPMSGRGQTRTFGGGIAMAGGGTLIAGGGAIASAQTSAMDAQFSMMETFKNLPPTQLVYREFNEFKTKVDFKESLTSQ